MPTRHLLSGLAANLSLLGACALPPAASSLTQTPVIVFVHGNGDSASIWQTTLWRFESNGWPKERLYAIDLPYPVARDDDSKPQAGRSSSADYMAFLASEVGKALSNTGASKVVLFGNSRGGNAIRNYIFNGGGDSKVSHAILSGTPIHGVWAIKGYREGNEAAGTGPFLTALNAPRNANGDEVSGPVKWMTIRSDGNDKYAQADGLWIGLKGTATNITAAGPELKGATNVVLARVDHRETAFSPAAFEAAHQFITGKAPASTSISKEDRPVLNGKITGLGVRPDDPASGNFPNNLPLVGANLTIYATDAATGSRTGEAVHKKAVAQDGVWGPFVARAGVPYEFVISAPGYATTHIYRSAFPRSSDIIHLRAERLADADKDAKAVVTMTRPRGYFDAQRDKFNFDGRSLPPGVPASGAGVPYSKLKLDTDELRPVVAEFNGEKVVGQSWSRLAGHVVFLELTQ